MTGSFIFEAGAPPPPLNRSSEIEDRIPQIAARVILGLSSRGIDPQKHPLQVLEICKGLQGHELLLEWTLDQFARKIRSSG